MKLIGERSKRTVRIRVQFVVPPYARRQNKQLTVTFHPRAAVYAAPILDGPRGHVVHLGRDEEACVLRFEAAPGERVFLHLLADLDDPEGGGEAGESASRLLGFKNCSVPPGSDDLTLTVCIDNFELYSLYQSTAAGDI